MVREIAIALAYVLLAFGVALAMGAETPNQTGRDELRPLVAPVETNPCTVAGACW